MMLLQGLGALLLIANSVHAFKNTSPALVLSSSSSPFQGSSALQSKVLSTSNELEDDLIAALGTCDQRSYYIYTQQHVSADDLRRGGMPKMQRQMQSARKEQVVEVAEVMGVVDAQSLESRLDAACAKQGKTKVESTPDEEDTYRVITRHFEPLSEHPALRVETLASTDITLEHTAEAVLTASQPSILIYLTTPPAKGSVFEEQEQPLYEMDDPFPSGLHTDLKRDLRTRQGDGNKNMQDGLPLFEKWQFLSPGIFMGLAVSLLLFLILYVGVSAIANLEVSYMAFSKEMGPQKGKQQ